MDQRKRNEVARKMEREEETIKEGRRYRRRYSSAEKGSGDRNEERKNGVEGRGREREKLKREPKVEGKREGSK